MNGGTSKKSSSKSKKKGSSKKEGGGGGGGNWEAPSFDARGDRKKNRAPRADKKKKTRAPRNGYGKGKAGPKKGGAGAHNWGSVADAGKDFAENGNAQDNNAGEDGLKEEEEDGSNSLTLQEFKKLQIEQRKKSEAFAAREVRKVEKIEGVEVKKKTETDAYVSHKKPHGRSGHNRNKKKLADASNFFQSAPVKEDSGRGERRGGERRGRGRGGRGRGGGERKPRRQQKINLQSMNEFPTL